MLKLCVPTIKLCRKVAQSLGYNYGKRGLITQNEVLKLAIPC